MARPEWNGPARATRPLGPLGAQRRALRGQAGFTLLELAIVLTLVGLIVGAVLRGQELIDSVRLRRAARDYQQVQAAIFLFQDKHGGLPGDFDRAARQIDTRLNDGNANQVIGTPGNAAPAASHLSDIDAAALAESSYFWEHLALGNFVPNVELDIAGSTSRRFSPFKTGAKWGVIALAAQAGYDFPAGSHVMRVEDASGSGAAASTTPPNLAVLDRKLDDGVPTQGDILGFGAGCIDTGVSPPVYLSDDTEACFPAFVLLR